MVIKALKSCTAGLLKNRKSNEVLKLCLSSFIGKGGMKPVQTLNLICTESNAHADEPE